MITTERQRQLLAKNVAEVVMNFETDPNLLLVGLDQEEDAYLTKMVLAYHSYAKGAAKDEAQFLWGMNSIIHYCLVDYN